MRKLLFLTWLMLGWVVGPSLAAGVNIHWGTGCWNDGAQQNLMVFACDGNAGEAVMTLSFQPMSDGHLVGIEATLVGMTEDGDVPSWWDLGAAGCRAGALSTSADFSAAPEIGCEDVWQNRASGGLTLYATAAGAGGYWHNLRMVVAYGVSVEQAIPIYGWAEYYACQVKLDYRQTVGAGSCAGCGMPVLWGFDTLKLVLSEGDEMLLGDMGGSEHPCLLWQGASHFPSCSAFLDHGLPARNSTWGQIKSLYRSR
jgi:hypothetical protein